MVAEAGLVEWLDQGEGLSVRLEGSPLKRPRRAGLARNAAIGLGNRPSEEGRKALLRALTFDPAALVREAAAWSLAQSHGTDRGTRAALDRAIAREPDSVQRSSMLTWRDNLR